MRGSVLLPATLAADTFRFRVCGGKGAEKMAGIEGDHGNRGNRGRRRAGELWCCLSLCLSKFPGSTKRNPSVSRGRVNRRSSPTTR